MFNVTLLELIAASNSVYLVAQLATSFKTFNTRSHNKYIINWRTFSSSARTTRGAQIPGTR
jgi:hypothetical protein